MNHMFKKPEVPSETGTWNRSVTYVKPGEKHPVTIKIEMHCHSNFSDGENSPELLAEKINKAGVKYAALTDHDTVAGLEPFRQLLVKYGIGFVTGIELTTVHDNTMIHLLAYGFHAGSKALDAMLHVHGILSDTDSEKAPIFKTTTREAIKAVHDAGGLTVLAHPLKSEPDFAKLAVIVNELCESGLDGIESIHAFDSEEERKILVDLAHKKGLVMSAGTDSHARDAEIGIEVEIGQWKAFRDAILDISSRNANISTVSAPKAMKKSKHSWVSFFLSIFMPAAMAFILFISALFVLLLPYFEQSLIEKKREGIRDLARVAHGVLDEAAQEAESGQATLEQAQDLAKKRIEAMRYGGDGKGYFWLQDLTPKILMHPYRPDLISKDVSEFTDARGVRIFVEFVNLAKAKKEGFINYVWQWNDNKDRLEAKESYVMLFEKWGWVIGTGIYDKDVIDETAILRGHFVTVSLIIAGVVLLLLLYLVRNGLGIEKSRRNAERLLRESVERYRALTEAATEGALFISRSRCSYANAVMYELLGCDEAHLELLEIDDIFPDIEGNRVWRDCLMDPEAGESKTNIPGVVRRCDGSLLNCSMTLRSEASRSGMEFMVLVRRNLEGNEYGEIKVDLENLLQLPNSMASDISQAIGRARQIDDVVILCGRTQELVKSLLENAASSFEITKMLSVVTDATTKKLIDIAINEIGKPPAEYVFIGLGSHGRESQTLYSDQDNAIIYRLDDGMDNDEIQKYFLQLANRICQGLELAGYRKCNGQKMANNPKWCQPMQVWMQYFDNWIRQSNPDDIMEFSVFFDFRAVAGKPELARELRSHLNSVLLETPLFLVQLAKNALLFSPPIRLFGSIITEGGKEHPGQFDIKAPNLAIVNFVRLYSLKQGVMETNTIARLDAISRAGIILDSTRRDIVMAFEAVTRFRLWSQALALQNNQELGNWVAPNQLGHMEEVVLKECFSEIEILQGRIQRDFFGGTSNY